MEKSPIRSNLKYQWSIVIAVLLMVMTSLFFSAWAKQSTDVAFFNSAVMWMLLCPFLSVAALKVSSNTSLNAGVWLTGILSLVSLLLLAYTETFVPNSYQENSIFPWHYLIVYPAIVIQILAICGALYLKRVM